MDNQPLHVHQFTETVVPPTCQENGYTLYSCECGYTRKDHFLPIGGHSFQTTETTPATCTEEGSIRSVCSVCGEETTQAVPALGHEYGEWIDQDYPTCEDAGKRVRQCSRCAATEEAQVAPLGHNPTKGTERYERGKVVEFFCAHCGQTIYTPLPIKTPRYGMIRAFFLTAVAIELLDVSLTILLHALSGTRYAFPLTVYGSSVISMMWVVLYCVFAKQIKSNDNYTRWMGIPPLLGAITSVLTNINTSLYDVAHGWADNLGEELLSNLIPTLPGVLINLFFAVLFFSSTKKKMWPVIIKLISLCVSQLVNLFVFISNLLSIIERYDYYSQDWAFLFDRLMNGNLLSSIGGLLSGAAFIMLIMPTKKKAVPHASSEIEMP